MSYTKTVWEAIQYGVVTQFTTHFSQLGLTSLEVLKDEHRTAWRAAMSGSLEISKSLGGTEGLWHQEANGSLQTFNYLWLFLWIVG